MYDSTGVPTGIAGAGGTGVVVWVMTSGKTFAVPYPKSTSILLWPIPMATVAALSLFPSRS